MSSAVVALAVEVISLFGFVLMLRLYRHEGKKKVHLYAVLFFLSYLTSWLISLVGQTMAAHGWVDLGEWMTKIVYRGGLVSAPLLFAVAVEAYFAHRKMLLRALMLLTVLPIAIYIIMVPDSGAMLFVNGVFFPASNSFQMTLLTMPYVIAQIGILVGAVISYRREPNWSDVIMGYSGLAIFGSLFWSGLVIATEQHWSLIVLMMHTAVTTACFVVGMIGISSSRPEIRRNPLLYIWSSLELRSQVIGSGILLVCVLVISIASGSVAVSITDKHDRGVRNALVMREVSEYAAFFSRLNDDARMLSEYAQGIPNIEEKKLAEWVAQNDLLSARLTNKQGKIISVFGDGNNDNSHVTIADMAPLVGDSATKIWQAPDVGWVASASAVSDGWLTVVIRPLPEIKPSDAAGDRKYAVGLLTLAGEVARSQGDWGATNQQVSRMMTEADKSIGVISSKFSDDLPYSVAVITATDGTSLGFVYAIEDSRARVVEMVYTGAMLAEVSLGIGIFIFFVLSLFIRSTVRPITALAKAAAKVGQGEFDVSLASGSPDEIGQATRAFIDMASALRQRTDELNEKMREQRDLLNYVAHEMRTPITAVRWALEETVERPGLDEVGRRSVDEAVVANERLKGLVDDLLELSRLERGALTVELTRVDLKSAMSQVLEELASTQAHGGVAVDWHEDERSVPEVLADRKRTVQILINIIGNAIKYSKSGNRVHVSIGESDMSGPLGRRGRFVCVTVQDWGIGIPIDQQSKIFSRFYRASNAVESKLEGTGLGLHLSKRLAQMQGGDIWFKSAVGEGSTFMFTLPVAE